MTFRSGLITGILLTLVVPLAVWWKLSAPRAAEVVKAEPPARVAKILKEDEVNNIVLSPSAFERLGILTTPIEQKSMNRVRTYGGEVVVPAGRTILVAAPLGGTLKAPPGGVPLPGSNVQKGEPVLLLLPLLTPESRITTASALVEAEGQVENARTQVEAAQIAFDRAKRLFAEQAGSKRSVDETQAQHQVAVKGLEAAEARKRLLAEVTGDIERGTSAPIPLDSPEQGVLRTVAVLPGQNVPAGAPLFEVVDISRIWIRVPVYDGDLQDVDTAAAAIIGDLNGRDQSPRSAAPAKAPPTANPLAGTTDFYYELDNKNGELTPGQRVGSTLTLKNESPSLVVPWSAIIHDIHGGTWVYEQTSQTTYVRRRVQVRFVKDGSAVLASGPPPSTLVVSAGAAELFGTEVGFSK